MGLDLLVFGDTAIDKFYEVQKLPKTNEASDVSRSMRFFGGMGANTAMVANRLGLKVGLVSVIGTDAEDYRRYMDDAGIRLFLKGIFGDTTKSMFFKSASEQISFFYKGVTEQLDCLDPDAEFGKKLPRDVKAAYMARTYLQMQRKVLDMYCDRLKVYNPGYGVFKFDKIPRVFKTVMDECEVIVLNNHELDHLQKAGFKVRIGVGQKYIITKGHLGATIHEKHTKVDVPAYSTKVVDASGAGDAFNAGFIAGHIRGYDIYESVKIANATASYVVEEWGCQTNMPTWDQVMERYKRIK
ncbi:MAG: PfkB family carbohydrate kinase [Candidatus Altiarchaeota archaeon]